MFAMFTIAAALAAGAESPQALHQELSAALAAGEPWKLVDYVLPEDRAPIAASFEMMATLMVTEGSAAELEAIRVTYGVKPLADVSTSAEFAAALDVAYADVTDYHGLSQDLWTFLESRGGATGEATLPKLKGGGSPNPALKIGKQKLPLVQREGRWYIDTPEPSEAVG
jgi:hypothetical protein